MLHTLKQNRFQFGYHLRKIDTDWSTVPETTLPAQVEQAPALQVIR